MKSIQTRWQGTWTALVTPFGSTGELDTRALAALARWQVDEGVSGLAPCGTTGEGATLSDDEHRMVIETVVEAVDRRVPVMAGCGSNDTRRTVQAGLRAKAAGADALLVVSPYYNKPNRRGMLSHYRAVAEGVGLPIVAYNVPGRTGQNLGTDWTLELAEIPGVEAVKEASGDLEQIAAILERRPDSLALLSGDDALALPTMALGAEGLVSVASNPAPSAMSRLVAAARDGRLDEARALHYRLLPLLRANFVESNPVPVKLAMALLGRCRGDVRAPLGRYEEATESLLRAAMAHAELLQPVGGGQ